MSVLVLAGESYGQSSTTKADKALEQALELMEEAAFEKANEYLTKAVQLYLKAEKNIRAAHCYNHLSSNNRLMSNLSVSQHQAKKALALLKGMTLRDPTERIRAYTNLGLLAAMQAQYSKSLDLLKKASQLIDDPAVSVVLKMVVISSMGYLYDDRGKYDKALYQYKKALDLLLAQDNPPKFRIAKLYNNMGVAYANKGLYEKARHYYRLELNLNLALKGKSHPDVAGTYLNIGSSYIYSGDVGEALVYFKQSKRAIERTFGEDHIMMVIALNSMAKCYIRLNNYKKAINFLLKAIQIKKRLVGKSHPELAISYINLANVYSKMGNREAAKEYYLKAIALREANLTANHPAIATSYNAYAIFLLSKEQPRQALSYLLKARKILLKSVGGNHPGLAETYTALGRANAQLGRVVSSISYFQKALTIMAPTFKGVRAKENPAIKAYIYPVGAISVLKHKAQALTLLAQKKDDTSLLNASLYTYYALSKLMDRQQWGYMKLNSKLNIARRSYTIYEKAIQATYQMFEINNNRSLFQLIFYFSEKSRGRVLLESVAHTDAKKLAKIPKQVLQKERRLEKSLSNVKQAIYSFSDDDKQLNKYSLSQLRDSLFTLNRKLSIYVRQIEEKYPKYYRLKYNSDFPKMYRLKERLKKRDAAIIEYFYGQSSLYAIVVTPEQLWVEPLSYKSDLKDKIKKFRKYILNGQKEYVTLSRQLYELLIAPIKKYINNTESLLIVPGGALRSMPFGALLAKTDSINNKIHYYDLPYLIKKYNVSYANSVSLNIAIAQIETEKYKQQFVGFAPVFGKGSIKSVKSETDQWEPLSFSDYEVTSIAKKFNNETSFWAIFPWIQAEKPDVYLGAAATEKQFTNDGSLNVRYIHLATHAFTANHLKQEMGIVFYQKENGKEDGILYTNEIYNLQLHTALVALSACKTGTGTIVPGEGIMGLSRAFQYAGANNLVVSMWNVNDRSAASLMIDFYTNLTKGYSMPQALSKAKRTMIHNRRYAMPLYWAPFKLIGSTALAIHQ